MKFRHLELERELEWNDTTHLCELIVENKHFMRKLYKDFSVQEENSKVSITENGQSLELEKQIDVVFNPLKLNFDNRRAVTTLLKLLVKTSLSEDFYATTNSLKAKILKYLDEIVNVEDFIFEVTTDDFTVDSLAKAVNMHIISDDDDFVEVLTDYCAMMAELAGIKVFVLMNLRSLINNDELERFHHNLDNHQIDVLIIESHDYGKDKSIPRILIDEDRCEI